MSANHGSGIFRGVRGSVIIAVILLVMDAVFSGSFLLSIFIGPIWLLFAIVKAVVRRNDRLLSFKRILIPVITLGLVFGNAWLQSRIARTNAELIIHACTQYQTDKGAYPKTLVDLIPEYLPSVPRAKYALMSDGYFYGVFKGQHSLTWVEIPPFGCQYYEFEEAKWGFLD